MKTYTVSQDSGPVADRVALADNFFTRFRGLMFRKALAPGEGLLLKNCPAIHCCFMRFPIDVVYLNPKLQVVGAETVKPWRLGSIYPEARHVLELEAGRAEGLVPGTTIIMKECK